MTKGKDSVKLFDVRLQERNVTRGVLTRKDIQRHLESLPDVASKSMTLAQAEADRVARMPPPPPPSPPAPVVRAYAPPPSLDSQDYDDDFDDDDDDDDLEDEVAADTSDKAGDKAGDAAPADGDDDDLGDDDDDDDGEPPAPIA